jgi:glycosyltransferase involved in cell wall biosynthesis
MVSSGQHTPKIAVITRTKNRSILLRRAIESVEAQTYDNYIHVIVNDGGDKKAIEDLLAEYPAERRKVVHNKKTLGLTRALNVGIQAVSSEYIAMLDDDDSLHKDRLKDAVEYLDKHPNEVGVVNIMDKIIEEVDGDSIKELSRDRWHAEMQAVSLYKQCLDNYLSNGAFTYRRTLYDELNGYDETLPAAEDWDFGVRTLLKYDIEILSTEHALYYYHHRPAQTGDAGNSVFAGIDSHRQALNRLQNKYLREDILAGRLGIGYIMNNLRYEREIDIASNEKSDAGIVRLEGHMNFIGDKILKNLSQPSIRGALSDAIGDIKASLKRK